MLSGSPLALARAAGELSTQRSAQIEELLRLSSFVPKSQRAVNQRDDEVLVALYAVSEDTPPAATLDGQHPIEKHWQVIRALVSLKDANPPAEVKRQ